MDAAAELGRNPVSKYQIQPEYGDEQADAGRDCRTRLRVTKVSGANADRGILFFRVQLTTCRIGNLTRLIHSLAICMCDRTYISSRVHIMFRPSIIFAWYRARSSYLVHRSVSPSEYKGYLTRGVYVAFEERTYKRRLLHRSVRLARIAGSPFLCDSVMSTSLWYPSHATWLLKQLED